MPNTKKKKTKNDKILKEIITNIRNHGMLLNINNSIINTKIESEFSYIKKLVDQSIDIRNQVSHIYKSHIEETETNVWENYQKWGKIFCSYNDNSDTNTLIELTSLEEVNK